MISPVSPLDSDINWEVLYEAAIHETDRSKIRDRVFAARDAILNKIQESLRQPAIYDQCAMAAALRHLQKLAEA